MDPKSMVLVSLVIFIDQVDREGVRLWMQVREAAGPLQGLWEFPGGKLEMGETPEQAAHREIQEEVGVDLEGPPLFFKFHPYTNVNGKNIGLYVFLARHQGLPEGERGRWFPMSYAQASTPFEGKIPPVNHGIIDEVLEYASRQFQGGAWDQVWA